MRRRTPPTAPGSLLVGNLWDFRRDPLHFLRSLRAAHGDIVNFRLVRDSCYLLSHPDYVKHVLRDHSRNYRKALFFDKMKVLMGNGLLAWSFEDEFWRDRRRLLQPPFRPRSTSAYTAIWAQATGEMIERWRAHAKAGTRFDAFREMMAHSLDLAARTLLSRDARSTDGEVIVESLTTCIRHLMHKVEALIDIPESIPTRRNRRFLAARGALDAVMYRLIEDKRRAGTDDTNDMLTLLVRDNEQSRTPVSDRQLRDDLLTMFLAGFETNASALAWTLWMLAQHPDYAEAVRQEVSDVIGDRLPVLDDLEALPLTEMVLLEVMRLYPPAWWMGRAALEDDVIDGYRIPMGSTVIVSQYVTHRHPAFWDQPNRFNPARFLPERVAKRHEMAYFPFGAGPRRCMGMQFAMTQLKLVVAMIVHNFRLIPTPGHRVDFLPLITMRPKDPVLISIEELRASAAQPRYGFGT